MKVGKQKGGDLVANKILEILMSDKAVDILLKYAAIKNMTPAEYVKDCCTNMFEEWAKDPERKSKGFAKAVRFQKEKVANEVYKRNSLHRFTIKRTKGFRLIMSWRNSRIQDDPRLHSDKKENIGKYCMTITKDKDMRLAGINFSEEITKTNYFYSTLKALRRNINKQFEKHGYGTYYKENKRRG